MEEDLTLLTDEELEKQIELLRERRSQARQSRITAASIEGKPKTKKGPEEISGEAGDILDDILGDLT